MKSTTTLILLLSVLTLISCSEKKEKKQEMKLSEPIKVVCSGSIQDFTSSTNNPDFNMKSNGKHSYIFKEISNSDKKSSTWTMTEDSNVSYLNRNQELTGQPGSPKYDEFVNITEDVINVSTKFWLNIDDRNDESKSSFREIKINRLSGEWFDRHEFNTENKIGSKMKTIRVMSGSCEKVNDSKV